MSHWLDKYIKEQKCNRDILKEISGKHNPALLQETAEARNWDTKEAVKKVLRRKR